MAKKKYEKPLAIEAPFEEALGRFAQVDPKEIRDQPLPIVEYEGSSDQFLIFGEADGAHVQLRFDNELPWFTYGQMATVFGVDENTVIDHVQNFLQGGELAEATTRNFRVVRTEGSREVSRDIKHFSLDVAFYVGYRVNSTSGVLFRRWATDILIRFAKNGFVVDKRRLAEPESFDRVKELRRIIQELRGSEANLYAELRDICSMCSDYQPSSDAAEEFFKFTQAKIFYAVTSLTPAALQAGRADADAENMGLQTWSGKKGVTKKDVTVAKNYLFDAELEEFSRLVSIVLDILDDQLKMGRLTTMGHCATRLDEELARLGRSVLRNPGPPSKERADGNAIAEYEKFDGARKLAKQAETRRELAELKAATKALPSKSKRVSKGR